MTREHPINILKYGIKHIWLMIVPAFRSLYRLRDIRQITPALVSAWLSGAWFDLLFLTVILFFGWLNWKRSGFTTGQNSLIVCRGIFIRKTTVIPLDCISAETAEHPFWLHPLHAVRIRVDTRAGKSRSTDLSLWIHEDNLRLFEKIRNVPNQQIYEPRFRKIALFSLLFSSSLSGVLYLAALIFQLGHTTGALIELQLTAAVTQTAELLSDTIAPKIPPAAMTVAVLLVGTWLLSFAANLLRFAHFRLSKTEHVIHIQCGTLTKWQHTIDIDQIHYWDIRQNLLMKLSNLLSVHICCSGYGNQRRTLPMLIPMIPKRDAETVLPHILKGQRGILQPGSMSFQKYLWRTELFILSAPLGAGTLLTQFPLFSDLIHVLLIAAEGFGIWMLAVKLTAWKTSGVFYSGRQIRIQYCSGFRFHTIWSDLSRLSKIELCISPIQRFSKRCDLIFYFQEEARHGHKVMALSQRDANQFRKAIDSCGILISASEQKGDL